MEHNVKTLGEGGDFNHKSQCGERMLNIAVIVKRSTALPLLPNVCYAYVWRLFSTKLNFENGTGKIKNRSDGKK